MRIPFDLEEPDHRACGRRQALERPLQIDALGPRPGVAGSSDSTHRPSASPSELRRSRARCHGDRRYIKHLETAICRTHAPGAPRLETMRGSEKPPSSFLEEVLSQSAATGEALTSPNVAGATAA